MVSQVGGHDPETTSPAVRHSLPQPSHQRATTTGPVPDGFTLAWSWCPPSPDTPWLDALIGRCDRRGDVILSLGRPWRVPAGDQPLAWPEQELAWLTGTAPMAGAGVLAVAWPPERRHGSHAWISATKAGEDGRYRLAVGTPGTWRVLYASQDRLPGLAGLMDLPVLFAGNTWLFPVAGVEDLEATRPP